MKNDEGPFSAKINSPRIESPTDSEKSSRGILWGLFDSWHGKTKGGVETLDKLYGSSDFKWSPDGKRIAVLSRTMRTVKIYDSESRKLLTKYDDFMGGASSIEFKSNSEIIAGPREPQSGAVIWNVITEKLLPIPGPLPTSNNFADNLLYDFSFDISSQRLVGSYQSTVNKSNLWVIVIYDLSGEVPAIDKKVDLRGIYVAIAPGGKQFAFRAPRGRPTIAEVETGKVVRELEPSKDWQWLKAIKWSPDGKLIATGLDVGESKDPATLHIWEVETGKKVASGLEGVRELKTIDFSPDGKLIAVNVASEIQIFSVQNLSAHLIKFPEEKRQGVVARFSPDGKRIGRLLTASGKLMIDEIEIN